MIITTRFDAGDTRWVGMWVAEPNITRRTCVEAQGWINDRCGDTRRGSARYVLRSLWRHGSSRPVGVVQRSAIDGLPLIVEAPARYVTIRMTHGMHEIVRSGVLVRMSAPEIARGARSLWRVGGPTLATTWGGRLAYGSWIAGYSAFVDGWPDIGGWRRTRCGPREWVWSVRHWERGMRVANGDGNEILTESMAAWLITNGHVVLGQQPIPQMTIAGGESVKKTLEKYTRGLRRKR